MISFDVQYRVSDSGRNRPDINLESDAYGEMTLEELLAWTKSALISISLDVLKEEQRNGFDENPIMLVDGRKNKPITSVSPLGKIQFIAAENISEILLDAYEGLLHRSKVLTGKYKASHYVFLNGAQVATDLQSLKTWLGSSPPISPKDIIRIVDIQPYARRLELLGVTAQRTQSKRQLAGKGSKKKFGTKIKLPNGTYQLTARSMRTKYKNNLGVRFSFIPGNVMGLPGTFKTGKGAGRPYLYPSIIFTVGERGTNNV